MDDISKLASKIADILSAPRIDLKEAHGAPDNVLDIHATQRWEEPDNVRSQDMEDVRKAAHERRLRRRRQAIARRKRNEERQEERAAAELDPVRERAALLVVGPLVPLLDDICRMQAHRFSRYLGDVAGDIDVAVFDSAIEAIARSKWEMALLVRASDWLQEHGPIDIRPKDFDDEQLGRAAKYLVGLLNNHAKRALETLYNTQPTVASIEKLDTMLYSLVGNEDEMMARFKADGSARLLGWDPPSPGQVDWTAVAVAVSTAITEKKLDRLVEVLLTDEFRYSDGSFMWTEHGAKVWEACGLPAGAWRRMNKGQKRAAAKLAARNRFAWLPEFVDGALHRLAPEQWETPREDIAHYVEPEQKAKLQAHRLLEALEAL